MNFKKLLVVSACAVVCVCTAVDSAKAQGRDRVVRQTSSQPTNLPAPPPATIQKTSSSRPTLSNPIIVVRETQNPAAQLVKKTGSSMAVNNYMSALAAGRTAYNSSASTKIYQAIMERWGKPYRYGSTGPNTYDCSGFVWSVFTEAGVPFTRASARSLWAQSEPVSGDDRFKFGTLVFLNGLGHMGIVADENGFFHASSSKGITYSPFAGYWSSRIVGFRRLRPESAPTTALPVE